MNVKVASCVVAMAILVLPDTAWALAMGSQTAVDHHAEQSRNAGRNDAASVNNGGGVNGSQQSQGSVKGSIGESGGHGTGPAGSRGGGPSGNDHRA